MDEPQPEQEQEKLKSLLNSTTAPADSPVRGLPWLLLRVTHTHARAGFACRKSASRHFTCRRSSRFHKNAPLMHAHTRTRTHSSPSLIFRTSVACVRACVDAARLIRTISSQLTLSRAAPRSRVTPVKGQNGTCRSPCRRRAIPLARSHLTGRPPMLNSSGSRSAQLGPATRCSS